MRWLAPAALLILSLGPSLAADAPLSGAAASGELLEQALVLAKSVPDRAERADAVGRVAAEIARSDPKRALETLKGELGTHQVSSATAAAARQIARDNRLLGLATLLRIHDMSTVMVALARIVAMEALTHFDDAQDVVANIEPLTVRRMVEREVTRVIWAEMPGERAAAVDVAVRWAEQISDPVTRDEALAYAAEGAAGVDLARAQELALSIEDADAQDLALRLVIGQLARVDVDTAAGLVDRIRKPFPRGLAGADVVEALMAAGRTEAGLQRAAAIRRATTETLEHPLEQSAVRERLALAMVAADPAGALSVASEVWPPVDRRTLECRLALTIGRDDPRRAEELLRDAWIEVRRIDTPLFRQRLAAAAVASAGAMAPAVLAELREDRPELVQEVLPQAVMELTAQDPPAGLALIDLIADVRTAEETRARAVALIAGSHPELARSAADGLAMPGPKSAALVALAVAGGPG